MFFHLECKGYFLCKDKETVCGNTLPSGTKESNDICNKKKWHSVISVKDKTSGLRNIDVTSPGSQLVHKLTNEVVQYPINIGSRQTVNVVIETSCCYDGVEITAHDLGGLSTTCVAGINPNKSSAMISSNICLIMLCIYTLANLKHISDVNVDFFFSKLTLL